MIFLISFEPSGAIVLVASLIRLVGSATRESINQHEGKVCASCGARGFSFIRYGDRRCRVKDGWGRARTAAIRTPVEKRTRTNAGEALKPHPHYLAVALR